MFKLPVDLQSRLKSILKKCGKDYLIKMLKHGEIDVSSRDLLVNSLNESYWSRASLSTKDKHEIKSLFTLLSELKTEVSRTPKKPSRPSRPSRPSLKDKLLKIKEDQKRRGIRHASFKSSLSVGVDLMILGYEQPKLRPQLRMILDSMSF